MNQLAVMVYSELKARPPDPVVAGFIERLGPLFALSVGHPGFVRYPGNEVKFVPGLDPADQDWGPWAPFDDPQWYDGPTGPGRLSVRNLSVWEDIDSVHAYTYRTDHLEAVQKRREWLKALDVPSHVAWWIEAGTVPSIAEGCRRIEYLHEHGSTPHAFTLNRAFDPAGQPYVVPVPAERRPATP